MATTVPVKVWKKLGTGWAWVTNLDTYTEFDFEWRTTGPGVWTIKLPVDSQSAKLTAARVVTFDYAGERFSGVPENLGASADERGQPTITVTGVEAHTLLGDVLCWPVPGAALTAQTSTHYAATGFAETVLRDLVLANMVTRRGDSTAGPSPPPRVRYSVRPCRGSRGVGRWAKRTGLKRAKCISTA